MQGLAVAVFVATYVAMAVGRLPRLRTDRAGFALMAVALLLFGGGAAIENVGRMIDTSTLLLLFGLMVVSGQFGASGFYDGAAAAIAYSPGSPLRLLILTVVVAGGLSAVLANDVIAFAMTPVLCEGLRRRGLDPRPYLIALAAATNAGSAATVIGNPQNIFISQLGKLDFGRFLWLCGPPALAAMGAVVLVTWFVWRRRFETTPQPSGIDETPVPLARDRRQFVKGLIGVGALLALFATPLPREVAALAVAALLMASRRIASRELIAAVDWNLLVLFACLFVVTGAFAETEIAAKLFAEIALAGWLPDRLSLLVPLAVVGSNTIGNVPAVVLLLQVWQNPPQEALYGLALVSTLAGNFLLVGSLANLIVVERAASVGVRLGFLEHAKCGVPVTAVTIALAALWLMFLGAMAW
jgi:Na+/H+ antiporter NhaD/arsenite permease-like protein